MECSSTIVVAIAVGGVIVSVVGPVFHIPRMESWSIVEFVRNQDASGAKLPTERSHVRNGLQQGDERSTSKCFWNQGTPVSKWNKHSVNGNGGGS